MNYQFLNNNWLIDRTEFRKLLEKKFNAASRVDCFNKTEFILLYMTVLCKFVSVEEFVTYFRMHPSQVNNIFKNLIDKGLVGTVKIANSTKSRVSRTDTLYTYTEAGYMTIKNSEEFGRWIFNRYRYVEENPKNLHDYVNGMNLFGVMTSIEPFYTETMAWEREKTFGNSMCDEGKLGIDGYLMFQSGKSVLFETDMNTESETELINKLESYCKHCFLDQKKEEYVIVFSCFFPIRLDGRVFVQSNIRNLIEQMKDFPDNMKAAEYYDLRGKYLEVDLAMALQQILDIPVGVENNGRKVREELTLGDIREMGTRFAIENPFYLNAFNRYQYLKYREKRRKLARLYNNGEFDSPHCATANGRPIYAVPTALLGNYIGFITDFNRYRVKIASCLEKYFGVINFNKYTEQVTYKLESGTRFSLRHCFSSESGTICAEYYSIDISSLLRIERFHKYEKDMGAPLHLIVIVDEYRDAYEVSMQIRDFSRHNQFRMSGETAYLRGKMDRCDILYLLKRDLERGKKEALFFYSGYEEYIDNKSDKVIKKDNKYHRVIPKVISAYAADVTYAYSPDEMPF